MVNGRDRTLILGFDALDFNYLNKFSESLPNITSLRSNGTEAPLRSTFPPWTGSAWPSMYTGVDPSHHGVYGFFDYEGYPDTGEIVTRNDVQAPALWNYLSSIERSSIVLNMPVTHPAESINGILIPGYLASEESQGYPTGIRDELSSALNQEYQIYSKEELSDDRRAKLRGYLDLIDLRKRAAKHLLTTQDWHLAVIQVQKTDAVFHNFDEQEAFRRIYKAADNLVGALLDCVPPDTNIVLCSDHGIGSVTGYRIHVNEILHQHGLTSVTSNDTALYLSDEKRDLISNDRTNESYKIGPFVLSTARTALDTIGITPHDVYDASRKVGIESLLKRLVPKNAISEIRQGVDWADSKAYCRIGSELGVRINLRGREPAGTIPRSEYDQIRDEVIHVLSRLETPNGDPAFDFVAKREEIYDGPFTEQACDIVFSPKDMNHTVSEVVMDQKFTPITVFDHKRHGVFVGAGPKFDVTGSSPSELSLVDVAPMVMALLGCDTPHRMTGSIPKDLLTVSVTERDYPDVLFGQSAPGAISDERVEEQLEDLGYL